MIQIQEDNKDQLNYKLKDMKQIINKKSKEINELKLLDRTVDQRFVDLEIRELTA